MKFQCFHKFLKRYNTRLPSITCVQSSEGEKGTKTSYDCKSCWILCRNNEIYRCFKATERVNDNITKSNDLSWWTFSSLRVPEGGRRICSRPDSDLSCRQIKNKYCAINPLLLNYFLIQIGTNILINLYYNWRHKYSLMVASYLASSACGELIFLERLHSTSNNPQREPFDNQVDFPIVIKCKKVRKRTNFNEKISVLPFVI